MVIRARTRRARRLRADSTDAERSLWRALRELKLPFNVRRQHPIGSYIADFAIPVRRLVIEVDGGQHAAAATVAADIQRTRVLEERGYRVLRVWNNDVLGNLDGVLQMIITHLDAPPPHPGPLRPRGRRGR